MWPRCVSRGGCRDVMVGTTYEPRLTSFAHLSAPDRSRDAGARWRRPDAAAGRALSHHAISHGLAGRRAAAGRRAGGQAHPAPAVSAGLRGGRRRSAAGRCRRRPAWSCCTTSRCSTMTSRTTARPAAIGPPLWTLFGMPMACNAGDGMFSLAHLAFFRLIDRGVPAATVLRALALLRRDVPGADRGAVSGHVVREPAGRDAGRLLPHDRRQDRRAAGSRARRSARWWRGATPEMVAAYRRYGAALGRAFQLQDDILGIWGDEAVDRQVGGQRHPEQEEVAAGDLRVLRTTGWARSWRRSTPGPCSPCRCPRSAGAARCCRRPFARRGAGAGSHRRGSQGFARRCIRLGARIASAAG